MVEVCCLGQHELGVDLVGKIVVLAEIVEVEDQELGVDLVGEIVVVVEIVGVEDTGAHSDVVEENLPHDSAGLVVVVVGVGQHHLGLH